MSDIQLPRRFQQLLETDAVLLSAVLPTIVEFEPWLSLSGTPFFPEYTDHGPKHISEVMAAACAIIGEQAWPVVTAADVAVLALAILVHDSAMHLSEEGFVSLVKPGITRQIISGLSDQPWLALWADFLEEASRFDARKLVAIFGDAEPARNPGLDSQTWTKRDRLLIGEFIRRHHARLGHEIAVWGVPSLGDGCLSFKNTPAYLKDLAGLVARSHGRAVRSCFEYLEQYDIRAYKGVHAVFLMAVVRVADYLQIQSSRAPEQVLTVQRLRSPLSRGEWSAHEAIRDIRNTHEDPEAIFIDAAPRDVKTYLKLKELLGNIQVEMDSSWASLGEVYGRYPGLNNLGLRLRRIRSSLDDEAAFAKTVSYIPCRAAFETADADLLALMVGPLYGNRPDVGIRELIQNAVDACRELDDYRAQWPDLPLFDLMDQDGDVVVTVEEGAEQDRGWLQISDRGIGMTAEVVRAYFLRAGASFRRSDAWRKLHEIEPGKSRVLRSGRFGVGVLAAFLLGDEIEVSTRHVDAKVAEGVKFSARIDSSEIELERVERCVGTTIRIRISNPETWEDLKEQSYDYEANTHTKGAGWDWYCLSKPKVVRSIALAGRKTEVLKQLFSLPPAKADLPASWYRVSHPDYHDIQWTYERMPELVCNGIKVVDVDHFDRYRYYSSELGSLLTLDSAELRCPNVSVFDPDGRLPLDLQRDGLVGESYPFDEQLRDSVIRDFLAFILVNAPRGPMGIEEHEGSYALWYKGFRSGRCRWLPFFCLPNGSSFVDYAGLRELTSDRVLITPSSSMFRNSLFDRDATAGRVVFAIEKELGPQEQRGWFRCGMSRFDDQQFGPMTSLPRVGSRMLLSRKLYGYFRQPGMVAKFYWHAIHEEFERNGWVLVRSGEPSAGGVDFEALASEAVPGNTFDVLTEWYVDRGSLSSLVPSPIGKMWGEVLGSSVIPFDYDERRQQFATAFEFLRDHIAAHERTRSEGLKKKKKSE